MKDFYSYFGYFGQRIFEGAGIGYSVEEMEKMDIIDALDIIETVPLSDNEMFNLSEMFCNWIGDHLVSTIALEKYYEVFNIDDTGESEHKIWKSFNVMRSGMVRYGHDIEDSFYVDEGTDIRGSERISFGRQIVDSTFIYSSNNVLCSNYIANSIDIDTSNFINRSLDIAAGSYLYNCNQIKNAVGAIDCSESSQIYFSSNLERCNHCLFCNKLSDSDFFIFNQPVEPRLWFVITELVKEKMKKEKLGKSAYFTTADNWCGFKMREVKGTFSNAYELYRCLSDDIIKYLLSIPNTKRDFLYNLTRNDKFLILG